MDKNTVVIAIDHGWSNMKTVHETFTSGIREITTEPALFENVLEKDGKYYKVGSERLKVKDSKVEDENYYLLSLAATAKELDRLGRRNANVYWAVGLPLIRFGKEKEAFIKYLRASCRRTLWNSLASTTSTAGQQTLENRPRHWSLR